MENKIKKTYRTVSVIFLPIMILLVMIFILLYNFGSTTEKIARSVVEEDLYIETENFAVNIQEELDIMTRMGKAFSDIMGNLSIQSQKDTLQMIRTLRDNSSAYMVVYCDENGIGFTQTDIKVNINKSKLVLKENETKQYYTYLQQDNIMQAEAIVSVIPIVKNDKIDGYILMYYSVSHVRKLFEKNSQYQDTFMIFSADNKTVITTSGLQKEIKEGTTLLELLSQLDEGKDLNKAKEDILNIVGTSFQATIGDESKYVICIPIQINDWYITIGYEKEQYEQRLTKEWLNTRTLITYLLVLIFTFIGVMLGITFVIYRIYNKHNLKLQEAAYRDLLTELYNKVTTENKIKKYIKEYPNLGAVLFILDIDNFKEINDSMGHAAGDEVLRSLGHYLKTTLGDKNIIGRVGGDEFFVFIIELYTQECWEKETDSVYQIFRNFSEKGGLLKDVTFSVGAAWYPKDANSFETLFQAADQALYEAKKKGKNQMVKYNEE